MLWVTALSPLSADTVAYWNFEGTETSPVTDGDYVQSTAGRTEVQATGIPVPDLSGNGNQLYSWDDGGSGHVFRASAADAPFLALPLTGEANDWFIESAGDYPASFTWSSESTPTGTNLDTWTSLTWTIEASVKIQAIGAYSTFVGREGNDVSTSDAAQAPLYFQAMPNGAVRILYVDAVGNSHAAEDTAPLSPGFWYHFAATCDGSTLRLWKRATGGTFEEVATTDVTSSSNPALVDPGVDANGDPWGWTIGRGRYGTSDAPGDDHGDRWLGGIDEVRISDTALEPGEFLAGHPITPEDTDGDGLPDAWEMANLGGTLEFGPADDYDYDDATNLMEYRASTDPDDSDDWPDIDGDGMNDGWEMAFFPNPPPNELAASPDDDPDNDYNSNLVEFLAGTDPLSEFSYPDEDQDWLNDGWERHFFPELTDLEDVDPDADPDGDTYSNLDEHDWGTSPVDMISSPDMDGDGLPDGWELKYFQVADEDIATVMAYQDGRSDPDGDSVNNLLEYVAGSDPTDAESKDTLLAYWRFEEATEGDVPSGGNGELAYPGWVKDASVYGHHLMTWATYTAPNYDSVVPAATIPATGAANDGSMYFLRNTNGVYFIESLFTTPAAYLDKGVACLQLAEFDEFTVEASFNTSVTGVWQVPICKSGNPIGGQPPFTIKIDTSDLIRAAIVDGSGEAKEIIGTTPVVAGSWYSVAVTATESELQLWIKYPGDASYTLDGTLAISGAWYRPEEGAMDGVWSIGTGEWAGTTTDAFQGNVDEVRIHARALSESEFLFHEDGASGFAAWADAEISDPAQRGESDDADGDGTTNYVEYLLGLAPMDGASFFFVGWQGGSLEWPAASGLEFTIERSETLETWEVVGTVTATGDTGSWTDPAPPEGRAFYRVVLATD
ncbi:hypothetical protein HNR46_004045 [Haloferula luteola]|uniref:LamG-like jellyroll fold domain-containing protein n=1 Tax=Haloferula luteola TaxID=595692 RepID=A0A840V7T2_9BACT|nr:LamG domain-containing protein [Haloferula luteola]MBB5353783.1 hypothetical protein [Haloferula luteola]